MVIHRLEEIKQNVLLKVKFIESVFQNTRTNHSYLINYSALLNVLLN